MMAPPGGESPRIHNFFLCALAPACLSAGDPGVPESCVTKTNADASSNSTNSIDDILASEDLDASPDAWKSQLADRIAEIIDRKRSSNQGRSDALAAYSYLLKAHYACDDIEHKVGELIPAILKSVKSETSERETIMALKGTYFRDALGFRILT